MAKDFQKLNNLICFFAQDRFFDRINNTFGEQIQPNVGGNANSRQEIVIRRSLLRGLCGRFIVANPREDSVDLGNVFSHKFRISIDDVVLETGIGLQLFQTFDCLLFRLDCWVHTVSLRLYLSDVEFTGVFDNHKIWEIAVVIVRQPLCIQSENLFS